MLFLFSISCATGDGDSEDSEFSDLVLGQANFSSTSNNAGANVNEASSSSLSSPKGIHFDGTRLYVADTLNHRVLIWNSAPTTNGQTANIVLGQANMTDNSPNRNGAVSCQTLSRPSSVIASGNRLFIADTGNHRILIYNDVTTLADGATADRVVGHANCVESRPNRLDNGIAGIRADTLDEPTDVFFDGARMYVADSGNKRLLIYEGVPSTRGESANVVVGQSEMGTADDSPPAANTLKRPTSVYASSGRLLISDTDNNRVLIFNTIPTSNNASASHVIGQASLTASGSGTTNTTLSAPLKILASSEDDLIIADSGNHRVLIYDTIPGSSGAKANRVLGQPNFDSSQPNRGGTPDGNTLNSPSGVFANGSIFWVTDTANHRVLRF